jgi:hypothetical protein
MRENGPFFSTGAVVDLERSTQIWDLKKRAKAAPLERGGGSDRNSCCARWSSQDGGIGGGMEAEARH